MDAESKDKTSMVFTGIFSGSAAFAYQPTDHLEAGIGSSIFHSIAAMPQYQDFSNEELRMEDYSASGGIFGATIAKLANALGNRPGRPYYYGTLVSEAIRSFTDTRPEDRTAVSPPAMPVEDEFKAENPIRKPNVNLTFQGRQNVTVFINCDSDVNFSFNDHVHLTIRRAVGTKSSSSKSKSRSESYNRRDRSKSHRKPSKHDCRNADDSKEKIKKTDKKVFDRKPKNGDKP